MGILHFLYVYVTHTKDAKTTLLLYYLFIQHRTKRWCLTIGYAMYNTRMQIKQIWYVTYTSMVKRQSHVFKMIFIQNSSICRMYKLTSILNIYNSNMRKYKKSRERVVSVASTFNPSWSRSRNYVQILFFWNLIPAEYTDWHQYSIRSLHHAKIRKVTWMFPLVSK